MIQEAEGIRFGAYYLSEISRDFGGDIEYVVAAYNAGPTTVRQTLGTPAVGDKDDFYRWLAKEQAREFLNR